MFLKVFGQTRFADFDKNLCNQQECQLVSKSKVTKLVKMYEHTEFKDSI